MFAFPQISNARTCVGTPVLIPSLLMHACGLAASVIPTPPRAKNMHMDAHRDAASSSPSASRVHRQVELQVQWTASHVAEKSLRKERLHAPQQTELFHRRAPLNRSRFHETRIYAEPVELCTTIGTTSMVPIN